MPLPRLSRAAAGLTALTLVLSAPAWAQEADKGAPKPPEKAQAEKKPAFDAQRAVTRHTLALAAGPLAYTATAEYLPLTEDGKDEPAARVFTVTYTADASADKTAPPRPVAFVFNGGPGAAAAYLHLGALGPKIVRFADDGAILRPPSPVVDNPDSWLAFTDLVFIDPVGTGYSRGLTGEEAEKRTWSPDGDARAMAEIVRLWLARHGRWDSPKLLVGESYGGFRIARMAAELAGRQGVFLNGLIMLSPAVDFATISEGPSGLLAAAFKLPSYAASAAFHHKTAGTPEDAARNAERFALTDYVAGLATLDVGRLDASSPLFADLAQRIGLPVELITRHRGRVPARTFIREIVRDKGRVASLYDGTFTGPDPDPASPRVGDDPFLDGTLPVYATAFAGYVQRDLEFRTDTPFTLLSERVNRNWEWPRMSVPSATGELQSVLALTPGLRVLIAHGLTDLITPYMASAWIARNLELPAGERDRVSVRTYPGGHMMYTLAPSRAALARDARTLVETAVR